MFIASSFVFLVAACALLLERKKGGEQWTKDIGILLTVLSYVFLFIGSFMRFRPPEGKDFLYVYLQSLHVCF